MTMAKGITNGAQPMGAVAISERIHDAIFDVAPEGGIEFFHGYTYSGHPAACRWAGHLDIYEREGLFDRGRALSPYFLEGLFSLRDAGRRRYPRLRHVRRDRRARRGCPASAHAFQKKLFDNGLHLKATGDSAIVAPPLIAERAHVDEHRRDPAPDVEVDLILGVVLSEGGRHEALYRNRVVGGVGLGRIDVGNRANERGDDRLSGYGRAVSRRAGSKGARESNRLQDQLEAVGGGGEVIKAMASGAVQIGEIGSAGIAARCRAESRLRCFGSSTISAARRRWSSRRTRASRRLPTSKARRSRCR